MLKCGGWEEPGKKKRDVAGEDRGWVREGQEEWEGAAGGWAVLQGASLIGRVPWAQRSLPTCCVLWVSVTFVLVQLVMFLELLHRLAEGRQHPTRPHVCRDDISPSQSAGVRLEMAKVCRWALCCRVLAVTQSPVPLPGHAASKLPDPCKAWDGGAVAGTARCPLAPCFGQLTAARGMLLPGQIPGVWLGLLSYTLQIL